jgi:hypothetical protein
MFQRIAEIVLDLIFDAIELASIAAFCGMIMVWAIV